MDMGQDELREILEEFFTEADEGLDNLEQDLIRLESLSDAGETDSDTVDRIFRAMHTLKGGAGFLGLEALAKLAHAGENLLDEIRGGKVPVDKDVMDNLLKTNDMLKELIDISKAGGNPASVNTAPLIARLEKLAGATPSASVASSQPPAATTASTADSKTTVTASVINAALLAEIEADPQLAAHLDAGEESDVAAPKVTPTPAVLPTPNAGISADLLAEIAADPRLAAELDTEEEKIEPTELAAAAPAPAPVVVDTKPEDGLRDEEEMEADDELVLQRGNATPVERRSGEDQRGLRDERREAGRRKVDMETTIRVETSRLDKVMNLVGELVLARNSLVQQLGQQHVRQLLDKMENAGQITANIEHLSRVTQDLQMSVLSTRMQPIKKVFDKIPRQVRELKNKLGKEVDLIIEGEMTEVDKTLVEELADPMVHLIRNSLDHGIEMPEQRRKAGKAASGSLAVRAFYEGNNVVIQVVDDGKGIDPAVIRQVAVKKGVIDQETADKMSDKEAIRLILKPGFSTANTVSDVSGRGVGMDVVNSKISDIKGSIDITSELGMGTTISIYLPLTLAIMQALLVDVSEEGFAIPIGDISEVIKFKPETVHHVNSEDVIELRGEVLPLFYLHRLTKLGASLLAEAKTPDTHTYENLSIDEADNGYVVVVREGSQSMGVVVDKLLGQEEAVVKPVSEMFAYNKAISGATITGDGTVHMILDIPYLIKNTTARQS